MTSIQLLITTFDQFLHVYGPSANVEKSQIYLAGIPNEEKENIVNETGLRLGDLPFKYLGVPLTCKKL